MPMSMAGCAAVGVPTIGREHNSKLMHPEFTPTKNINHTHPQLEKAKVTVQKSKRQCGKKGTQRKKLGALVAEETPFSWLELYKKEKGSAFSTSQKQGNDTYTLFLADKEKGREITMKPLYLLIHLHFRYHIKMMMMYLLSALLVAFPLLN